MAIKEKLVGSVGAASAATSALGGYQVCHNLCMAVIALLSVIGITVSGMPLMFLNKVAVPFWIAGVAMLGILGYMRTKMKCVSGKLLVFNSGLLVAGVPFAPISQHPILLWVMGGALVLSAATLYLVEKLHGKKTKK